MKIILTLAITLGLVAASDALAGSATWMRNPVDGDWNNSANWLGDGPPNGPTDVATFNFSRLKDLSLSAPTTVDSIVYTNQAKTGWTTTVPSGIQLSIVGAGIINSAQNFTSDATGGPGGGIIFSNSASSGIFTTFTNRGGTANGESGGYVEFLDNSWSPDGTLSNIINEGGAVAGAGGGFTELRDRTHLGSTQISNLAGVAGASGGSTSFYDSATTGGADMFANGGTEAGAGPGSIHFFGNSSTLSKLTVNGGTNGAGGGVIEIRDDCQGFARLVFSGNGVLDLSNHNPAVPVTVSSIEGEGAINLGSSNLTIGLPWNLYWHYFSGVISDDGKGGSITFAAGDQFTALVISGASTYTGGTTIVGGYLYVLKANGSGTGLGPVNIFSGLLGGTGTIGGALTVGDGTGDPSDLEPGSDYGGPGILTVQRKVTFKSDGIYTFQVDSDRGGLKADQLNAKGVSIESGATFNTFGLGTHALRPGTTFFAIKNTSPSPIAGTFANLADGSTVVIGNNTFQANYEGGDGNDLTLTVVP